MVFHRTNHLLLRCPTIWNALATREVTINENHSHSSLRRSVLPIRPFAFFLSSLQPLELNVVLCPCCCGSPRLNFSAALFFASFNDTKLLHSRARSGVLRSSKSGVTNQPALNVTLLANITLQVHCLPDISVGNQTKQTCITTRGGRNGHVRPKKPQIGRWSRNRCSLFFVICKLARESVLA